jgi:hypothetical protein
LAAVVGLNVINRVTDFQALSPDIHPVVFEIEAIVLSAYEAALLTFYLLAKENKLTTSLCVSQEKAKK